jgi:DNA-directed RNA polymerase specialized sigma subunit
VPDYTDIDQRYATWKADPTPGNLHKVVDGLQPAIDHSLRSINAGDDRLMRTKARNLAAKAITSYDPAAGAALPTWTSNQLMPLRRIRRDVQQPVKVPERTQLDAYSLMKSEQEFIEKMNREPDLEELADFSKIPVKRIEKIRRQFRRMPTAEAFGDGGFVQTESDYANEALDYIYRDVDGIDRKIIEMKTGYGGRYDPMEPKDIAMALGLTPSQLSRRSAKIAMQIQEVEDTLRQVT